jgi:peptidoglycan/LPS O-acetylase OafA/YrhL
MAGRADGRGPLPRAGGVVAGTGDERRRGRQCSPDDAPSPGPSQRVGRRPQRGAGRDDVVDDQDPLASGPWARPEHRAVEAGGPVATGLGQVVAVTLEQTPARHTELGRDPLGDELGLVEPASPATLAARRCPRHHVDVAGQHAGGQQPVDEQPGDVMAELTTIAVLEAQDHISGPPGERERSDDVARSGQRHRRREGEPAGATQHRPDTVTAGTTGIEDHADSCTPGVSQSSRPRSRTQGFGSWSALDRTLEGAVATIDNLHHAPSTSSRPRLGHLPAVDGLRALSVAAVFAFHAGALPGGFIGVDVFFVISGFLITGLALAEMEGTGRFGLAGFWARRARRLLPALFLLVGTIIALVVATGTTRPGLPRDIVTTLTYVANWTKIQDDHDYFAAYEEPSLLEHTWSLAVEEQFYVIWPLALVAVLWAVRQRADRVRPVVLGVSVVIAGASTAWAWWLAGTGRAPLNRLYFGTDTRAVGLAAGCILACVLARGERTGDRAVGPIGTTAAAIGLGTLAVLAVVLDGTQTWLYGPGFAIVAAASVALVSAASGTGIVARALGRGPLPAIGKVSYGIYLWHWPIIVVLDSERTGLDGLALGAVWIVATAAATAISWWLVERPAPLPTAARPGIAAAYTGAASVLLIVSVTVVGSSRPEVDPSLLAAGTAVSNLTAGSAETPTTASTATTTAAEPSAVLPPVAGVPEATAAAPLDDGDFVVLLLGDSVAESLGPGPPATLLVDRRPVRAVNHGIVACPVHPEGRWRYDSGTAADDPAACDGADRFDAIVAETDPDLIVLLFGWPGTIAGRELADGRVVTACEDEHDRRWAHGHVDLVRRYSDVAPVVAATIAPPQTFLDTEQRDRPACLNRALRSSDVPTFEWGEWLCPEGDCTGAAGLRRDPVHFASDVEVLDLVWRRLVSAAVGAAAR